MLLIVVRSGFKPFSNNICKSGKDSWFKFSLNIRFMVCWLGNGLLAKNMAKSLTLPWLKVFTKDSSEGEEECEDEDEDEDEELDRDRAEISMG